MDDDIRQEMIEEQAARLRAARKDAGLPSASEAARRYRWTISAYRHHENGTRAMGWDDAERYAEKLSRPGRKVTGQFIIYGHAAGQTEPTPDGISRISVMGMVGAGAVIEPEFEQETELHQIDLPYLVPVDLIGFQVDGDSMMPRYEDGDVILVWREPRRALESFYGEEALVRTADGRRYLKVIQYGKTRNTVNLHSFNAKMIEGVRLEWIGEIHTIVRAGQVQRLEKQVRRGKEKRPPARP